MYLVSESELEKLVKGELEIGHITIPEKNALITWSGEDVKLMLEKKGIKADLQEAVDTIVKALENCECSMCVECAMDCIERR